MHIPLIGEMTPLRALFLFLFFYSNDSNSLGTWSTFGAGMLLSNLAEAAKADKIQWSQLITSAVVTFAVLGYAAIYLEQMRMMLFLSLQSLWVPVLKHRYCRITKEDGTQEYDFKKIAPAMIGLIVFLYLWDGMSGLTSGALFLVVLPEFMARLPPLPSWKTMLVILLILSVSAPFGVLVYGAVYHEREMLEVPEEYKSTAKWILGAKPESVPDYYQVIGVRRGAEPAEIKKVMLCQDKTSTWWRACNHSNRLNVILRVRLMQKFRDLSKIYHPDKTEGNPELQEKFVKISEAVRKLTGKKTDREAHFKELENAELQDMITRAVYYCGLLALWFVMTVMSYVNRRGPQSGGEGAEGQEGMGEVQTVPRTPPKPRQPLTRSQWLWLLFTIPVMLAWIWVETTWAETGEAEL